MTREGVGEVFRKPSKKDAISRAYEIASASGHPCVVVTHHENGIVERKSFGYVPEAGRREKGRG